MYRSGLVDMPVHGQPGSADSHMDCSPWTGLYRYDQDVKSRIPGIYATNRTSLEWMLRLIFEIRWQQRQRLAYPSRYRLLRNPEQNIEHRADSRCAPSQWEIAILCNDVSQELGASLKSALERISSTLIASPVLSIDVRYQWQQGSFNWHGFTLIPAWISNYIHYKV